MSRLHARSLAVVVAVCTGVGLSPLAAGTAGAQPSAKAPHIVANPNNLMVNTKTTLTGRNFAPGATLHLVECSQKSWIVPQNPCDSNNSVDVTTNAAGGFKKRFTVETCPAAGGRPFGFSEICYVGVPTAGLDNYTLVGAAKITVTGP